MLTPRIPLFAALTAFTLVTGACRTGDEGGLEMDPVVTDFFTPAETPWPDSAGDVLNDELAELCSELWEYQMKTFPTWSTQMGDGRYDGKLFDNSTRGERLRKEALRDFQADLEEIDRDDLVSQDQLTFDLVQRKLRVDLEREAFGLGEWNVNARGGPQVRFLSLAADQPVLTPKERADYLERWRKMATSIRRSTSNVETALAEGRVASRTQIENVLAQLDSLLATPAHLSPLVEPATGGGRWVELPAGANLKAIVAAELGDSERTEELRLVNPHLTDGLTLAQGTAFLVPADDDLLPPRLRGRFLADVWGIVENDLYPVFREYRRVLRQDVLPKARPDERAGVQFVLGGTAYYQDAIEHYTSLELSPEEIHQIGLAEVERINGEMVALGIELFGRGEVNDMRSLRAAMKARPELYYESREEIVELAESATARMYAALPQAFARLPRAPMVVVEVPPHEEAMTTMAYYRRPSPDGSRPGRYYVNTYQPETKPRWEAEVLAFHEGVPGHHLQIALAAELEGLPMVRRNLGMGAYTEGWALYTETLADEMGMYSSDLQRLGMLSFDAWRSSRLVVDTGLHALGWSRQRAIDFLGESTLADAQNIENEIDRYITTPGQALGYKLGQLELFALREAARAALGTRFTLAGFHEAVLADGPVTLPMLRTRIERWIEDTLGR